MNKMKLVGMSMIFYYTKLHLTNCNGPWVVSVKQNTNFNFQPAKMVSLKVVHPLKIYQHTKFHGPTLTDASFHPPQKFESPSFWNAWRYGIKMHGVEVIFNDMISVLNFIKIYQLVQKLIEGKDRQTYKLVIS
jgi:hypothetical protein